MLDPRFSFFPPISFSPFSLSQRRIQGLVFENQQQNMAIHHHHAVLKKGSSSCVQHVCSSFVLYFRPRVPFVECILKTLSLISHNPALIAQLRGNISWISSLVPNGSIRFLSIHLPIWWNEKEKNGHFIFWFWCELILLFDKKIFFKELICKNRIH